MEPTIVIIDVPESATPQEVTQVLNAPGDSYFLVTVLPMLGGHRAYLRRYKPTPPTKTEAAAKASADEAAALSVLRANLNKPVRTIVSLLDVASIKRGRDWVCDQKRALQADAGD